MSSVILQEIFTLDEELFFFMQTGLEAIIIIVKSSNALKFIIK